MTTQPRSRALFGGRWPSNAVIITKCPTDLLEIMFGPADHDAHVSAWRRHNRITAQLAWADVAHARVRQHVNTMIARERAQ
jgi:hypothetical protein